MEAISRGHLLPGAHQLKHEASGVNETYVGLVETPTLREAADAQQDVPPDSALQPVPADEFDQRLSW